MWPAEAFNLARETPNFVYFVSLIKTPIECVKTYQLWPFDMEKKTLFWPAMRFELCTPEVEQ